MSDPFGQLEEQLRGAVARRRRAARWLRRGGLAVLGAGLAGGGVAIAGGMLSSDGPSPAARAIAVAEAKTRQLPVCTARWKRGEKSRLVAGDVPAIIRKQFAVFRRPTRPGELRSFNQGLLDVGGRDVLRDGVRVTRAPSGRRYALILSFGPAHAQSRDPIGCLEEVRKAALARPQASDDQVRARIDEIIDTRVNRAQDLLAGRSLFLTVMSLIDRQHRSGGGGVGIIRRGRLPSFGSISAGGVPRKVRVDGLVPDEVHDIQVIDRDGSPRARAAIIPVAGNVYDAVLPPRMGPRATLRWRDRSGRIIRRVRIRY